MPSPLLKGGVLPAIADPRRHRTVQQWTRKHGTVLGYRWLRCMHALSNFICSSSAKALMPSRAQSPGGAPITSVADSFQRCPRGHAGFCGTTHWSSQTLRWRRKCLALGPGCGMALTRRRWCCTGPERPEASATGSLRCRVSQLRAHVDVTSID